MDKNKLRQTREWIRSELETSVNFWLKNGMDSVNGGIYTCLDREGKVYSTDKSVWMQGRAGWIFAYLCSVYGVREEWLNASKSCIDFMERHCINRAAGNRMYFTVTADGNPLRQRRYCTSELHYALANAEYFGLTGEEEYLRRARFGYEVFCGLNHGTMPDPLNIPPKVDPATRPGRSFGGPMICLNLTEVMLRVDKENKALYEKRAEACVEEMFKYNVHPELKCVLENVAPDGEARLEYTDGRTVIPGHDMEGVWFILEHAKRTNDTELLAATEKVFDWAAEMGWDKEYGGLLFMCDALNKPMEAYEHDMKLWWPHNEMLISALMLYRDTGKEKYLDWFYTVLDYCRAHFVDTEHGEWYGYLRRDGKPTEPPVKGSTFKGPFHLPRSLIMCDTMIGEILGE